MNYYEKEYKELEELEKRRREALFFRFALGMLILLVIAFVVLAVFIP